MSFYLLGLFVALMSYIAISSVMAWYPLRKFKGPFWASWYYIWLARTTRSGQAWKIHMATFEMYNEPLIRISPDCLITADPGIVRKMSAARSRYTRSNWYNSFRMNPYRHSMLSSTETTFHDDLKAMTAGGYTGREVPALESNIDGQIAALKNLLREKYLSTLVHVKYVDFSCLVEYFTMDTITKIAYGQEFWVLGCGLGRRRIHKVSPRYDASARVVL